MTKSANTLPKLSQQVKQQVQEANKLEFPMARFLFKDIEFPDENHYRRVKENLKKEYEESQKREKYPPSQIDQVFSLQTGGTRPDQPTNKRHLSKTQVKPANYSSFGNQKRLNQENLRREEEEYLKRDFNPINSLVKNSSTAKLIERHHESLNKIHQLHKEAQEKISQKEKLA